MRTACPGGRPNRLAVILCLAVLGLPCLVFAASDGQNPPTGAAGESQEPRRSADFLFGQPHGSVGVRGNWTFARAGSDLFDFVTDQLTLDKSDFNSPGVASDVSVAITSRLDAQAGFEWSKTSHQSEYRDFVDNNFLPITQTTSMKMLQVTGGVRFALTPRGDDVSRFAWVPRRVVPYVGAGAGAVYYDFTQRGDFVDFQDHSVFADVFRSNGWTPSGHVFAGVDLQIYRALYGSIEGRYTRASATLGRDFIDFDPIDLSGFRVSAGINVLF